VGATLCKRLASYFAIPPHTDNNVGMSSTDSSSISPAPAAPAPAEPTLHCPICDYNLHGLPEPRCPECGFAFHWDDLLVEASTVPYFFETSRAHHARAFVRTLIRSATPPRFWRVVRPTLRPHVQRLVIYAMIATVLGLLASFVISGAPLVEYARWNLERREFLLAHYLHPRDADDVAYANQMARPFGTVQEYVDWAYPNLASFAFWRRALNTVRGGAFLPAIIIGWPILTFLALMIFRVSLLNANVSPAHVLRCTVYSGDIVAWLAPLLVLVIPALFVLGPESVVWSGYIPIAILILLAARIVMAYQLYLRIKRSLAMVISSQIMMALIFCKLALWLNGY
jgi:hypothetical protein